jgi:hypothetical protein
MKKRIFTLILALALMLLVFPAANASEDSMVTVTYPDGTVVQMSLQAYLTMMAGGASSTTTAAAPEETAAPDAVPWPTYNLPKYSLDPVIKWESYRVQAHSGPSRNYSEVGAYKPYKISRADGLFIEGGYILVDMNYTTVGVRRVYFTRGTFHSTGSVPEITLTGYPAVTTESVVPRYGPGGLYDPYEDASVGPNTALTVFFEENGYVFAEFEAGFQLVRAWINANKVKPE